MPAQRVFGLDIMRASAILIVLYAHGYDVLIAAWPVRFPTPRIDGVDIFFVLSGFLIGGIMLKMSERNDLSPGRRAVDFMQRRWLRTLPNYYLFLCINILLVIAGVSGGLVNRNAWVYAFFLQSLYKPVGLFFWESWSLVVEEWFYLLYTALLFAGVAAGMASRRALSAVTALMIVSPVLVRFWLAPDLSSKWHLEQSVRLLAITRMDTIAWGVLASMAAATSPSAWRAMRWPGFVLGLSGCTANLIAYGDERLLYSATWSYTVNAVCTALLLPMLSCWVRVPWWGAPVTFISLVSYALYLVHQPVRYVFNRWFAMEREADLFLPLLLYWIACIAISWLVYRFWERRFMALRDGIGDRVLHYGPSRPSAS